MLKKLIREPLVHFIAAALAIFAASALIPARPEPREIIRVSAADVDRLAAIYASETGRMPGPQEFQSLIADHVEVSALALEARRLGLDQGDTVVERRLAQKMRFMISDLAVPPAPDEAVLRAWFDEHSDAFQRPAEMTFDHVFFRESDEARLRTTLAQLNGPDAPDWRSLGDAFMLERSYDALPAPDTDRLFGREFTRSLAKLATGSAWQGPVTSAFGVHLVRITDQRPARLPEFETVRDEVLSDWQEAELARANAEAVAEVVSRYSVEIESQAR